MLDRTATYRTRASEIIKSLQEEKISSDSNNSQFNRKLNHLRQIVPAYVEAQNVFAPSMTAVTAITLLGVGLCLELSQRFALEYCLKYGENNVSLIMMMASDNSQKENHMMLAIGDVKYPENLLVGKTMSVDPKDRNQALPDFFKENKHIIFADPLLNCFGNTDKELKPMHEFCEVNGITHVFAVRPFSHLEGFVKNAKGIKENAEKFAKLFNTALNIVFPDHQMTEAYKEVKYKGNSESYLDRLQHILGNDLVKMNKPSKLVSFPTFWLKQLGTDAVKELSKELEVSEDTFKVNKM